MVKERVLAVPDTSFFIAELPEATRNIIRKDLEEHAREHHYRLEWDRESKDYVAMSWRFPSIPKHCLSPAFQADKIKMFPLS